MTHGHALASTPAPIPRGSDDGRALEPMGTFDPAFSIVPPAAAPGPVVFASPHSGAVYPDGFLAASRLDALSLRRSEDAFVDALFAAAPEHGAPLLRAHFPRAFLDVNREAWELDPRMFADPLPAWCNTRSLKVAGGLGTIARIVADGADIYRSPLPFAEARHRVETLYEPYHAALSGLLNAAAECHGCAVLIDCHSMPSVGRANDRDRGDNRCDVVLGDRFGTACAPVLTRLAADTLQDMGYRVARNAPYAGGYCTAHYGDPTHGRHALQIEINRALYMDERAMSPRPDFDRVRADLSRLIARLTALRPALLQRA